MPIEKRPANPLPKGARAGSRQTHRVADGETLESLASKYHVPLRNLLLHNFATLNPAEINWYLREHVGCTLPTADGTNWRFSSKAQPGLIYLPDFVMRMEAIDIVGHAGAPPRLAGAGPTTILASSKFAHEFKYPPKPVETGYLLVQGRFAIEGEIRQQSGTIRSTIKKDQIKLAVETKLSDCTKATFAAKVDEKVLDKISDAVASGSKEGFVKALAAPIEASIKTTYRWGKLAVVPELGAEVSTTPVIVRVAGEFEDSLFVEGFPFHGKFVAKIGFNVGLSAKGWAYVASKVGRPALQRFLSSGGRALGAVAEWLVSEGVLLAGGVAIGTIIGTLAITALTAWIVNDAKRKGELQGLATWYVSAFVAKVFDEERPSGFIIGDVYLRDQLVELGERDAVLEARRVLREVGDPAMNGSDTAALAAYRNILVSGNGGSYYNTKVQLRNALEAKSRQLVGL